MKSIDFIPPKLRDSQLNYAFTELLDYLQNKIDLDNESILFKYSQIILPEEYWTPENVNIPGLEIDLDYLRKSKTDTIEAYFKEIGAEYFWPVFGNAGVRLEKLLALMPMIRYFKGTRTGVELILDILLGKDGYRLVEWWEKYPTVLDAITDAETADVPLHTPTTFEIEILNGELIQTVGSDTLGKLRTMFRHYCYGTMISYSAVYLRVEPAVGMAGQEFATAGGDYARSANSTFLLDMVFPVSIT